MSDTKEDEPGATALAVAKSCVYIGTFALFAWGGSLMERFGWEGLDGVLWWGLAWFVMALGCGLYAWGARSGSRHAAKGEDTER